MIQNAYNLSKQDESAEFFLYLARSSFKTRRLNQAKSTRLILQPWFLLVSRGHLFVDWDGTNLTTRTIHDPSKFLRINKNQSIRSNSKTKKGSFLSAVVTLSALGAVINFHALWAPLVWCLIACAWCNKLTGMYGDLSSFLLLFIAYRPLLTWQENERDTD